jgi:hypothetical protein
MDKTIIKDLKKSFNKHIKSIKNIDIVIKPIIEYYPDSESGIHVLKLTPSYKKLISSNLEKRKKLLKSIFQLDFINVCYNERRNLLYLTFNPKEKDFKLLLNVIYNFDKYKLKKEWSLREMLDLYVNYINQLIEGAPDTWMEGNIEFFKFNKITYLFNFEFVKLDNISK